MSGKKKTDVIWFRFKFSGDVNTRAAVIRAADRMFRQIPGVIERRDYTEEEVVGMVKAALKEAALVPGGQQAQAPAPSQSAGRTVRPTGAKRETGGDNHLLDDRETEDEDKSSTAEVGSASLADRETEER